MTLRSATVRYRCHAVGTEPTTSYHALRVARDEDVCSEETAVPLVVQKFGGTSVANAERLMAAARRAIRARQAGNQVVVVVSARGDTTDDLIELAREISENPHARE